MIANAPTRVNVTAQKMARFLPYGKPVSSLFAPPDPGTRPLLKRRVGVGPYSRDFSGETP
jgi:hypothetical protein